MSTFYVATYTGDTQQPTRVRVEDRNENGTIVRDLHHYVRHSPTGFSWGYAGSGSAELARCILIDALDASPCPVCHANPNLACPTCLGERFPSVLPSLYQRFKEQVIAQLDMRHGFTLSRDDVLAWAHRPDNEPLVAQGDTAEARANYDALTEAVAVESMAAKVVLEVAVSKVFVDELGHVVAAAVDAELRDLARVGGRLDDSRIVQARFGIVARVLDRLTVTLGIEDEL